MIHSLLGLETRSEGGKREQTKIQPIAMIQEMCDIVLDKDGISRGSGDLHWRLKQQNSLVYWMCRVWEREYKFDSRVVDLSNWINHLIN